MSDAKQQWADQIENRLIDFGADIIGFTESLPKSFAGIHIGKQLLRAGTSPAPNFAEARGAESRQDFVHKLKIVIKELNETQVWLKMLSRRNIGNTSATSSLLSEVGELSRIINASIKTAKSNR
ncbi:four helix bundle protein [Cerasicoccus maritimus]|uniref:four helix bundle protein n=1 Tax=Cerasicoccus maritimus TaxID=490089 RepID=UPI0028528A63|nr:four helix bundle protein [Cerasicoccus maritimus]